ncbi:hypothetical protein BJV74DRAFT_876933 [Russula compacta]|nr:hypothetical protein BJV74DRAFT_876933 [Russula compacta]
MNSWEPFNSRVEYEFANYHFVEMQSLAANIDKALDLWAANAPWANSTDLYNTIDRYNMIRYQGPLPPGMPPKWMMETYQLCTWDSCQVLHNQLATLDFCDKINYVLYCQFNGSGECVWSNLMSADWSWSQVDKIIEDATNEGAMFVPVVAGSDKMTVSVATGHQEYHPVYMSPGNLTNTARCAHGNSVLPVAFLPIPKKGKFPNFLLTNVSCLLGTHFPPLKNGMTMPEVVKCPDGHFHCAVYGLGPYIADYPEQVWLAAIVKGGVRSGCDTHPDNLDAPGAQRQMHETTDFLISAWDPGILWTNFGVCTDIVPFTHGFPCADIHELLTPNLLHQVIKGTFKDHLVMWVNEYLYEVYLSAVAGHIPSEMVKCILAFLDFCYIAQRNALTNSDLEELQDALTHFHHDQEIFVGTAGVNGDQISLPRQHSLMYYLCSIQLFGSPNGLCSSIMESKHIKAVKEPWRHSSCYKALKQMLVTNSHLDKLASAGHIFSQLGIMEGMASSYTAMILRGESPQPRTMEDKDDNDDVGPVAGPKSLSSIELAQMVERGYPHSIEHLANHIEQPKFPELLQRFLYITFTQMQKFHQLINIYVFHSAIAHFYAPSDLCGQVECTKNGFVPTQTDRPDKDTGLWVVELEFEGNGCRTLAIINLDSFTNMCYQMVLQTWT